MKRTAFNENWYFLREWRDALIDISKEAAAYFLETVRLPHSNCVLPFDCFDQDSYQKVCGYVRFFHVPEVFNSHLFVL